MKRAPEIDACFSELAGHIRAIAGDRPLVFMINPGNWGDSLIREGAEQFLRAHGLAYSAVRYSDIRRGKTNVEQVKAQIGHPSPVLLYNGCGAFTGHYDTVSTFVALAEAFDTAIFLPATFALDVRKAGFPSDTHFFVRDRFESRGFMPDVPFCHDMAFFLEPEPSAKPRGTGWFMRLDAERPVDAPIPAGNVDLSDKGRAHTPVAGFLRRLSQCEVIHTNRLHVAIGGALLGREVHLYPNDYFKIRAIYRSSLEPYFPKVHFHERLRPEDLPPPRGWRALLGRAR